MEPLPPVLADRSAIDDAGHQRAPEDVIRSPKILIVDDEPINIKVVRKYLAEAGHKDIVSTTNPREALVLAETQQIDLMLLDIMMPEISGLDVLQQINMRPRTAGIPVIILTASTDKETRIKALRLGATDFLNKPVDPVELLPRVRNALVVKAHIDHLRSFAARLEAEVALRTAELSRSHAELVACLARAAEYRDDETGNHVKRVGRYVEFIAAELGLEPSLVHLMGQAATLHDIGKIGISDQILHKPGALDSGERDAMRLHCEYGGWIMEAATRDEALAAFIAHTDLGARLLTASSSPVLRMASRIALTHHERWDGTGYPAGLAGENIPLEGRITAIADVFDALRSARPYKPPLPLDECLRILREGRGTHFDPAVLDAFFRCQEAILAVEGKLSDIQSPAACLA